MPNWTEILREIQSVQAPSNVDMVRKSYITKLSQLTGRNVIAYYSGWLQKPQLDSSISDVDMNGFMTTINKMNRTDGLDLILHTPGGSMAATQALIFYLREMFGKNIRAIIPQLAMSGGTMIACSCAEIIMGKQSSLGPIDPQFNGISCHGVIDEFNEAVRETKADPGKAHIWRAIIEKYHPTFLGDCRNAIKWAKEMVQELLISGMLDGDGDASEIAKKIVEELSDHSKTKSHSRHLSYIACKDIGLKVILLEDPGNEALQDAVLSVHHSYMHTFAMTQAFKIIENQIGAAYIQINPFQQGVVIPSK